MRVECTYISVGAEMEAYGDQVTAASNPFCCKTKKEPSRKPCNHYHSLIYNRQDQRGHWIIQSLLFKIQLLSVWIEWGNNTINQIKINKVIIIIIIIIINNNNINNNIINNNNIIIININNSNNNNNNK